MMQFHSLADFLAMGGYGFYVWLAYGITLVLVVGYLVSLRRQRLNTVRHIRRLALRDTDQSGE